jgi:hypothetical protein
MVAGRFKRIMTCRLRKPKSGVSQKHQTHQHQNAGGKKNVSGMKVFEYGNAVNPLAASVVIMVMSVTSIKYLQILFPLEQQLFHTKAKSSKSRASFLNQNDRPLFLQKNRGSFKEMLLTTFGKFGLAAGI